MALLFSTNSRLSAGGGCERKLKGMPKEGLKPDVTQGLSLFQLLACTKGSSPCCVYSTGL